MVAARGDHQPLGQAQWPGLCRAAQLINTFIDTSDAVTSVPGLQQSWQDIKANLIACSELPTQPMHIGVLGPTNAGKSSLLNRLLDCTVLPSRAVGRSTTSSVIELGWNNQLDNNDRRPEGSAKRVEGENGNPDPFRVEVQFMSEEAWVEFRVRKMREWADPNNGLSNEDRQSLLHLFRPVFGNSLKARFSQINDRLRADLLSPDARPEPAQFLQWLRTPNHVLVENFPDAQATRLFVSRFQGESAGALAATKIIVKGPFELLRGGMRLVDLPGVHDVNTYRGGIAERAIRSCSYVWVLGPAAEFGSLQNLGNILERVIRDGLLPRCAVVATKADLLQDDFEPDTEVLYENCRETITQRIQDLIDLSGIDGLELPPIILTSRMTGMGFDTLADLVGQYERELLGHVTTLARALLAALDRMAGDLDRLGAGEEVEGDGGEVADKPKLGSPEQKAELERAMRQLVDNVCNQFRTRLNQDIDFFLRQFAQLRATQPNALIDVVTNKLNGIHPSTLKAVLARYGGPHWASNGNYYNLDETLGTALSSALEPQWRNLFAAIAADGTRLETDMSDAVNAALGVARGHPYFANAAEPPASLRSPVRDLRAEIPGGSLPFHDQYFAEEINRSKRNFREELTAAAGREAGARGVFAPTPAGPGYRDRSIGIIENRLADHSNSIAYAAERAIDSYLRSRNEQGFLGRVEANLQRHRELVCGVLARRLALAEQEYRTGADGDLKNGDRVAEAVDGVEREKPALEVVADVVAQLRNAVAALVRGSTDDVEDGLAERLGAMHLAEDAVGRNLFADVEEEILRLRERGTGAATDDTQREPELPAEPAIERRICPVCGDDTPVPNGLLCGLARDQSPDDAHFLCRECANQMVQTRCNDFTIPGIDREGRQLCFHPGCAAGPYAERELLRVLDEEIYAMYERAKDDRRERVIRERLEEAQREEAARLAGMDLVDRSANELYEVLNSKCPSCQFAFGFFDGCFAVKCSSCPRYFCGYCLAPSDDSETAHEHVRRCALNPAPGYVFAPDPPGAEAWFKTREKERQRVAIEQFLRRPDLAPHMEAFKEKIRARVADLGFVLQ